MKKLGQMNAKKAPPKKIFSKKLSESEKMCRGTAIKNRCRAVPRHRNFGVPCRAGAVEKFEGISSPVLQLKIENQIKFS